MLTELPLANNATIRFVGRFLSADTIVPNPANPQDLNRFAYVRNNPVKYTDPSGHVCVQNRGGLDEYAISGNCNGGEKANYKPPFPGGGGGGFGEVTTPIKPGGKARADGDTIPDPNPNGVPAPTTQPAPDPQVTPPVTATPPSFVESYCGDMSNLACAASLTQDAAALTDLVGVGLIEAPTVIIGCLEGGYVGCAVGEYEAWRIWNLSLNKAETTFSGLSLILTVGDDLINNGGWGENSSTSLVTFLAGGIPLTPSWDLAVDTYASGYNHGIFNGIYSIGNNGLIK